MLGCPDHEVWKYAQSEERTVCTINASDFRRLSKNNKADHCGVLAIASGNGVEAQFDMTMVALNWLEGSSNSGDGFRNRYIEVDENGEIILAEMHYFDT